MTFSDWLRVISNSFVDLDTKLYIARTTHCMAKQKKNFMMN